jgi:hypothetical protein
MSPRVAYASFSALDHQSKAAPKPPAKPKAKAPAKPKPTTKRVLADVDENAEESFVFDNGDDSGPSAPRAQPAAAAKNKKSASETYTKVVRHILRGVTN